MKKITIIGFGRFGQILYKLLKNDFQITIYTRHATEKNKLSLDPSPIFTQNLEEAYKNDTIFFAVPISQFEYVIKTHKKYFRDGHVLIDVLSVKMHAKKVYEKYLEGTKVQAILTHPMFGPDSAKNGFDNLPLIMNQFLTDGSTYQEWKQYFLSKNLKIIEMTPEEHDKIAANSQGLTHFIGRLVEKMEFKPTPIDSIGAKKLHEIVDQTCNDTWELFHDLQIYNPYTKDMRLNLGRAYEKLYHQLLPTRVNAQYFVYGIQGGIGSFNEEALLYYIKKNDIRDCKIEFLYTTEKVLQNLRDGNIDFGLFAISNSTGGLVEESIQALTKYQCSIVEDFEILVRHFLMKRREVKEEDITIIMAHPQVLKQCEKTLAKKYSHLILQSGIGDVVDTAKAAEELSQGKLPKNTAILGPENLAKKYNFDIIAKDLQDKTDNFTRFLLVKR